jgi:amino acid adenylation domain-containing protein
MTLVFSQDSSMNVQNSHNATAEDIFVFPVSFAQQRLWFLDRFEPGSPFYNLPTVVRLQGKLNVAILEQCFQAIVQRHESLRTTFTTVDGQPVQEISSHFDFALQIVNLRELPVSEREVQARSLTTQDAQRPFDLERDSLFRVTLLALDDQEQILLLTMHHIISDGWSMGVILRELAALYKAFSAGEPSPLPDLPIQYADFAVWQRNWLQGEVLETQLGYWKQQLDNAPPLLELPSDRPRPTEQTFRGATQVFELSQPLTAALKALSRREDTTLFMTLLAAFKTLLSRYTGQADIVVGSAIANRNRAEIESLIGFFVNSLVLRTDLSGNPSFKTLLSRVREVTLAAYAHQDLPFEKLVEELQPERSLSHNPLFQVMFQLRNAPMPTLQLAELTLTPLEVDQGTTQFDLSFDITEQAGTLQVSVEYSTDLFDSSTISRMFGHFQMLLAGIVANPDQCICYLPLLTTSEQQKLGDWGFFRAGEVRGAGKEAVTCHQLFEAQVERTPDAVAVVFDFDTDQLTPRNDATQSIPPAPLNKGGVAGGGITKIALQNRSSITYRELNQRANQIASYLQKLGVKPEVLVGICVERSLDMVAGMLGVLKAGGAYVPLDPSYPQERIAFMLADSQVSVLLTQQHLKEWLPENKARVVLLDADWEQIQQESQENPTSLVTSENLVYMIYTSGSTGKAKGVMVEHRNLVNAYRGWEEVYQLSSSVRCHLQMASFSFDVFTGDVVRALCSGGKLILCPRDRLLAPHLLYDLIQQQQVDCAEFVPVVLRNLVQYLEESNQRLTWMRLLICGSDVWYGEEYEKFRQFCGETRLINSFGVTEATIDSSYFESTTLVSSRQLVPIGRPFPNTQLYILDQYLQPVPIGIKGELYIGGAGVTRGYFNRPELTAEKFIKNPFSNDLEARLYKTGDVNRYLLDGDIEFIGRLDNQVKIRGFRIELGEIETTLSQNSAIRECVVLAREDLPGEKRLVAYLVQNQQDFYSSVDLAQLEVERLEHWQTVYDNDFLNESFLDTDPTFNIGGWNDSYTGQLIPETEMRQWVDNTVKRILALKPKRVLEIGCGTGLLLFRIAPHCVEYYGTDFSEAA